MASSVPIKGVSVFAVTTLSVFVLYCLENLHLFRDIVYVDADIAADAILAQRAEDFTLLTGHYSWWRFHHPGPFFFYIRGLFGLLLGNVLPAQANAYLLGALFSSALFVGVTAFLAYGFATGMRGLILALVATMAVLRTVDATLADPWLPLQIVMPFVAYMMALVHLALGRRRWAAGLAAFCGAVLVHGYITMAIFVVPTFVLAFVHGVVRNKENQAIYILSAGSVGLLFALPIVLDAMVAEPDNLDRILASLGGLDRRPAVGWAGTTRTGMLNLRSLGLAIYAVAAVLAVTAIARRHMVREIGAATVMLLLVAGLFAALSSRLPEGAGWHSSFFLRGAVLGFLIVAICAGADAVMAPRPVISMTICGALLLAIVATGSFSSAYKGNPTVKQFADFIEQDGPGPVIVHRQGVANRSWRMALGTAFELRRRGRDVCFSEKRLAFLVTDAYICPPKHRGSEFVISMIERRDRPCLLMDEEYCLYRPSRRAE